MYPEESFHEMREEALRRVEGLSAPAALEQLIADMAGLSEQADAAAIQSQDIMAGLNAVALRSFLEGLRLGATVVHSREFPLS